PTASSRVTSKARSCTSTTGPASSARAWITCWSSPAARPSTGRSASAGRTLCPRNNLAGKYSHPRQRVVRGMALLLVIAVIALAAVLGYAMLSGATLQNRAGANQVRLAGADYLAESGMNIAMYYLQNPDKAPGYPSFGGVGYWTGTGGEV